MDDPPRPPSANQWRLFTFLMLAIYCLRGVMLSCVIPPLEMWDEYQHVAYIDFLSVRHRIPIINESPAPTRLIEAVIQFPQNSFARDQLASQGAVDYLQYWRATAPIHLNPQAGRVFIYEAQHPPIYYWLMGPIYHAAGGSAHLAAAVCVLRLVNVGISSIGIGLFLAWLKRACRQTAHAMLIGAAVALHPLFLLNSCRVANDSL